MSANRGQEISHLIRLEYSRRSAADKDRLDHARRSLLHGQLHLPVKRMQIIHYGLILQHVGVEITVKTFIRAKRNMNIYGLRGTAIVMSWHSCLL
ncbi:hypothetical protein D3C76_1668770 [compost metagenome]